MRSIDAELVTELVAEQFPPWRDLTVAAVPDQGWDNRTFRLGDELSVRLPSGAAYVAAVEKEERVLPFLDARLPLPVPTPVAVGRPGAGYPYPWSVRRWLPGETVDRSPDVDRRVLAQDVGGLLAALHELPTDVGPAAGRHSHFRGCHPSVYSELFRLSGLFCCRRVPSRRAVFAVAPRFQRVVGRAGLVPRRCRRREPARRERPPRRGHRLRYLRHR